MTHLYRTEQVCVSSKITKLIRNGVKGYCPDGVLHVFGVFAWFSPKNIGLTGDYKSQLNVNVCVPVTRDSVPKELSHHRFSAPAGWLQYNM